MSRSLKPERAAATYTKNHNISNSLQAFSKPATVFLVQVRIVLAAEL